MLFYFHFSYDPLLPLNIFTGILIILAILAGPILVFYWVFRNPSNRETDYKIFKEHKKWLSLICAVISLIIIVVVKSNWLFESGLVANRLIFISMIAATLAFIFGIVSLPRWQGFVAMAIFCFVWFYIFYNAALLIP